MALTLLPLVGLIWTLEGLVFALLWIAFMAGSRVVIRRQPRVHRPLASGLVGVVCVAGFVVGGIYWLPAAIAFTFADDLALRT